MRRSATEIAIEVSRLNPARPQEKHLINMYVFAVSKTIYGPTRLAYILDSIKQHSRLFRQLTANYGKISGRKGNDIFDPGVMSRDLSRLHCKRDW